MNTIFEIDDDTLMRAAKEALTRPSHFGYFGDLNMFEVWGFTVSDNRDSNLVTKSNYRSMVRDLTALLEKHGEEPGDYMETVHSSHWLCGWIDQLAVRVLIDPDGEIEPANITGPFRWITMAASELEVYPFYDESDHSELESAAADEAWDDWYRSQACSDLTERAANVVTVPDTARDAAGNAYDSVADYIEDLFDSKVEQFREGYYECDDTCWSEEAGSGMVNHGHDAAVAYAAFHAFGWKIP